MRYSICEYKLIGGIFYLLHAEYDLSCTETIKFIRDYTGTADEIVIYAGLTDEVFCINFHEKFYKKYYVECDKSLNDYLKRFINQVEQAGYQNER